MPRARRNNRKSASSPTPRIERLQDRGLDKSEIVARLTGTRDGGGGADELGAGQLRAIGFNEAFIKNTLGRQYRPPRTAGSRAEAGKGGYTGSTADGKGGDGKIRNPKGGGGGGGFEEPIEEDPLGDYLAQLQADMEAERLRNQESAFDMFNRMLEGWGIPVGGDIQAIIRQAAIDGYTPDQMELIIPEIQATETWKKRFPGWHTRTQNGYNQISVGEYLALENSYQRILQSAGMPPGFYDDHSDFGNWIANNVSPDEISARVDNAMSLVRQVDSTARGLLAQFYGVGAGDIAAYFLDSKRALPSLDRQYKAVNVASFAARNGLNLMNSQHYEDLVDKGVTVEAAAQGYGVVSQFSRVLGGIAEVYGETYTQSDAEQDVFFNRNEKRQKLVNRERAAFAGSSGFASGVSGRGSTAGSY